MKLVVGLGNPGVQYQHNRHNVGFILLDDYVSKHILSWENEPKFDSLVTKTGELLLAKPQTFMNNSGEAVSKLVNFYKLDLDDVVVMHDDVDLVFGKTVLKKGSSSAGHHGVESIIAHLGTSEFWRYRVGIGRPQNVNMEVCDWVLQDFSPEELAIIRNIPFPIA